MGYLERDGLPNFSKAVISFWFNVPQASIDAAKEQYTRGSDASELKLLGVIPLLTFGASDTWKFWHWSGTIPGEWTVSATSPTSPSFVGIFCSPDGGAVLQARLQYATGGPSDPNLQNDLGTTGHDFYQVGGIMDGSVITGGDSETIEVIADQWHHVLISFDMSDGSAMTTSPFSAGPLCKFWWAFDDVNYNGKKIGPNNPVCVTGSGDANGIWSNYGFTNPGIGNLPGSFSAGALPTNGYPVGIPSDSDNSSFIYNVELAKLQVFTGVTIDTSVVEIRRAFVTADGTPAASALAQQLLGKAPDILLDKASDWINGRNLGTVGPFVRHGSVLQSKDAPGL